MEQYHLRPHHGLCIHNFVGKGYSPAFAENMKSIIAHFALTDPLLTLTSTEDVLCAACPNNCEGCVSAKKVCGFDASVLQCCGLSEGVTLHWSAFAELCKERVFAAGHFTEICADCEWLELCTECIRQRT